MGSRTRARKAGPLSVKTVERHKGIQPSGTSGRLRSKLVRMERSSRCDRPSYLIIGFEGNIAKMIAIGTITAPHSPHFGQEVCHAGSKGVFRTPMCLTVISNAPSTPIRSLNMPRCRPRRSRLAPLSASLNLLV